MNNWSTYILRKLFYLFSQDFINIIKCQKLHSIGKTICIQCNACAIVHLRNVHMANCVFRTLKK